MPARTPLSAPVIDEQAQLRSVEEALLHKFGNRIPPETICAEVQRTATAFRDARVRTFVPVLIQHDVTSRLRRA